MNSRPGALPPSPPHSVARSSNGTGLYSANSGSGGRKYSMAMMEEQLVQHHRVLKEYLAASERDDRGFIPHNRARDKLLRLSPIQFQELSTDVYDELLRREDERNLGGPDIPGSNVPKYLLPKQNFHPKRNQARQKLSTLAVRKFRELATDVLYELERRLPQINSASVSGMSSPTDSNSGRFKPNISVGVPPYGGGLRRPSDTSMPYSPGIFENNQRNGPGSSSSAENGGRPLPKQFQSNTMIPNKGVMIEDDDDGTVDDEHDGDAFDLERDVNRSSKRTTNKSLPYSLRENQFAPDYQPQISALESRIDELEAQLKQKEDEVGQIQNAEKTATKALEQERLRSSDLTTDLERQLRAMEDLNNSLEIELQKAHTNNAELMARPQENSTGNEEWHERYLDLEKEFHDQQQITDEVRQEAMQSLQEMRLMSEKSNRAADNEEKLQQQVTQLEASLNEWKNRYAKTRTQLRSLKATSMAGHIDQPNTNQLKNDRGFTDPNGLIKDVNVTKFQMSIDELLHLAHREEPSAVLDYMRSIVATVRVITSEADFTGTESIIQGDANGQKREKLKAKVSAATNNLIITAKAFSAGDGLSPVALVDAAAASLSSAVIELIKLVKIKYSPSEELLDDDASELQPIAYSRAPSRNKNFQ